MGWRWPREYGHIGSKQLGFHVTASRSLVCFHIESVCLLCVLASTGEKSELTMVENGN